MWNIKAFNKKIVAFVLAGCMVLPSVAYLKDANLFGNVVEVSAANPAGSNVPVKVVKTTDAEGFVHTSYFEAYDLNGNGVIDAGTEDMVDISSNPSSPYYTKFRKSQYYITGNTGAPGADNSPSKASYPMKRYNADGTRVQNYKLNATNPLGSKNNPVVILEILPDELSASMAFLVKGQEPYDFTYMNMFSDMYGNGSFSSLLTKNFLRNETAGGTSTGVFYNDNQFVKEVIGFGYHDQELAQAPEIDYYFFDDWYISASPALSLDVYDDSAKKAASCSVNTLNDILGITGLTDTNGNYSTDDEAYEATKSKELHLYARWSYESYDNIKDDYFADGTKKKVISQTYATADMVSDSETFIVEEQTGASTVKVKFDGYEREFERVVFHYCLPSGELDVDADFDGVVGEIEASGKDVDGDGLKGEYEKINIAPQAPVSFEFDYDFDNQIIQLRKNGNEGSSMYDNYFYPSLMGNTDWYWLSSGKGFVQVISMTANEFYQAKINGNEDYYKSILDNVDLVYLCYQQYGGMFTDAITFVNNYSGAVDAVGKAEAYSNLLKEELSSSIESCAISGTTIYESVNKKLTDMDLEPYVIETLMKNMAAKNSLKKQIGVVADINVGQSNTNTMSNLYKFYIMSSVNFNHDLVYETWYEAGRIKSVSEADAGGLYSALCSDNVISIDPCYMSDVSGHEHGHIDFKMGGGDGFLPLIPYGGVDTSGTRVNHVQLSQIPEEDRNPLIAAGWRTEYNMGLNSALSTGYMSYNGDNSLMQLFMLHGGTNYTSENTMTKDGFDFLREEGVINTGTNKITTALAIHSLLFSSGGSTDQIVIDNESGSRALTADIVISEITDTVDSQASIKYHMNTNHGTIYYLEYYKVNEFKPTILETLASSNVSEHLTLAVDPTAGTVTYGVTDALEFIYTNIKPLEGTKVKLDGQEKVGFSVSTAGLAVNETAKYVLYAHHEDTVFKTFKYVEVKNSNMPFNLD